MVYMYTTKAVQWNIYVQCGMSIALLVMSLIRVMWLIYGTYMCIDHPYKPLKYLAYMAYMHNLMVRFISNTSKAMTC